ncbi:MAG: hypothetical protein IJ642_01685 [Oscillospiraceae bacterium]|nr:hypothetical protein [Oscillospiraceae bacterium]
MRSYFQKPVEDEKIQKIFIAGTGRVAKCVMLPSNVKLTRKRGSKALKLMQFINKLADGLIKL